MEQVITGPRDAPRVPLTVVNCGELSQARRLPTVHFALPPLHCVLCFRSEKIRVLYGTAVDEGLRWV